MVWAWVQPWLWIELEFRFELIQIELEIRLWFPSKWTWVQVWTLSNWTWVQVWFQVQIELQSSSGFKMVWELDILNQVNHWNEKIRDWAFCGQRACLLWILLLWNTRSSTESFPSSSFYSISFRSPKRFFSNWFQVARVESHHWYVLSNFSGGPRFIIINRH